MDTNPKPDGDWTPSAWESERHPQAADTQPTVAEPDPSLPVALITNIVVHLGDTFVHDHFGDGSHQYRLFDQSGDHVATFVGHSDPSGNFVLDAIQSHIGNGGRKLLPVRTYPFTTGTNSVTFKQPPFTYTGDPPSTISVTHFHRHPHTKPDDALTIDYWHKHDHTHPYAEWPHTPERDADAALHDPGPGHGHDERGGDTPLSELVVIHGHGHYHGDGDGHTTVHTHDHSHTGDEALSKFHGAGHGADIHRHPHPTRDG